MHIKILFTLLACTMLNACNAETNSISFQFDTGANIQDTSLQKVQKYSLNDFFRENQMLETQVNQIFDKLRDEQRVAQMIMPAAGRLGKPDAEIMELVKNRQVGGVILLNGTKESFKRYKTVFDSLNRSQSGVPLLYSADAEPSLINRKISNSGQVVKTSEIPDSATSAQVAKQINQELKDIGILYNFAPVVDLSVQNKAIGNRSYGSDPEHVKQLANAFIQATQNGGVIATAKHFPGHGLVKGDSHHKLVFIDGEMKEVALYQDLIDKGVLSIMVGHIAVENNSKYNTNSMPATCSKAIVTDLLKNEMGFKGLISTDAMNMGAVASIPNSGLLAAKAGCDIILMPPKEKELIYSILNEMDHNPEFKEQIYGSVKKIIRMKLCAGLIL